MPGFGIGPFGQNPFGRWGWGRTVFWDSIPQMDRAADVDHGNYLAKLQGATAEVFDDILESIRDFPRIRDATRTFTQYSDSVRVRLGSVTSQLLDLDRQGLDGKCYSTSVLFSEDARFSNDDRLRLVRVRGSAVASNNRDFTITAVISRTYVVVEPELAVDGGPFRWELYRQTSTDHRVQVWGWVSRNFVCFDGYSEAPVLGVEHFANDPTPLERYGRSAVASVSGLVVSRPVFQRGDLFKRLCVWDSSGVVTRAVVNQVVSASEILLESPDGDPLSLVPGASYEWALLPHTVVRLPAETSVPRGVVLQAGVDGVTNGTDLFRSVSARFAGSGYILQVANAGPGSGDYTVLAVVDENTLRLDQTVAPASLLAWYLREPTGVGNTFEVELRRESLLRFLAQDFGIELDTLESDTRQRSWVQHVAQWTNIKGTASSYEGLGRLSGFDAAAVHLYGVTPSLGDRLGDFFRVYSTSDLGRSGKTGILYHNGTAVCLQDDLESKRIGQALFDPTDVGRYLQIYNAALLTNNLILRISQVISSTEVSFDYHDMLALPEPNSGALVWAVVRPYATVPPVVGSLDDANVDLLSEIVESESEGAYTFALDRFAWDADFRAEIPVEILSSAAISSRQIEVIFQHRTGSVASVTIGSVLNGQVLIETVSKGVALNSYTATVTVPGLPSQLLGGGWDGQNLTLSLGTDAGGLPDAAQNTALAVAALVGLLTPLLTATPTGTGLGVLSVAEVHTFAGGKDEFLNAPEVVQRVGFWKIRDAAGTTRWLESVPVLAGGLTYRTVVYDSEIFIAGAGLLSYECEERPWCGYCPSSTVQLEARSDDSVVFGTLREEERLWERWLERVEQVRPAHVRTVLVRELILEAVLPLSAELEDGVTLGGVLIAPLTVTDIEDLDVDFYPVDTVLTATVEDPAARTRAVGLGILAAKGSVT